MNGEDRDFSIIIKKEKGADIPTMVVEQMISLISDGTLKPGDKLPSELEMTRRFNISRISLREAIKLLEAKGYVESKGRRGKFIRAITDCTVPTAISEMIQTDMTSAAKLFEVKSLILTESAALSAARIDPRSIEKMQSTLDKMRTSSPADSIMLYHDFFSFLSDSADNTFYTHLNQTLSAPLYTLTVDKGHAIAEKSSSKDEMMRQLFKIISAVKNGSAEETRATVKGHLDHLEKALFA
jgi:GntR family transcriptional repressor for pyruvate dehydrogenase complex